MLLGLVIGVDGRPVFEEGDGLAVLVALALEDLAQPAGEQGRDLAEVLKLLVAHFSDMRDYLELVGVFLLMLLNQTIPLIFFLPFLLSFPFIFPLTLSFLSFHPSFGLLEELIVFERDLVERSLDPTSVLTCLKRIGG